MHFYSSRKSWSFTEIAFIQSLSPFLSLSPTHPHIWCAIKSVKFYIFLLDITIIFRLNLGTAVKNDKMLAQTFFGLCLCPGHFTYTHISTVASVTRWLYYFFNIWPFTRLKFCLITLEICQSWLKIYQNTKLTLKMFPNNWIFFAQMATFRIIWSHWLWPISYSGGTLQVSGEYTFGIIIWAPCFDNHEKMDFILTVELCAVSVFSKRLTVWWRSAVGRDEDLWWSHNSN